MDLSSMIHAEERHQHFNNGQRLRVGGLRPGLRSWATWEPRKLVEVMRGRLLGFDFAEAALNSIGGGHGSNSLTTPLRRATTAGHNA